MTSQQIIDKLIKIELHRISPGRNHTNEELEWERYHVFYAKPTERQFYPKLHLDYNKEYAIHSLDCERGSPKIKLKGFDKLYDYRDFNYSLKLADKEVVLHNQSEFQYLKSYQNKYSESDMYFLIVGNSVKIGVTIDLKSRLKQLSTSISSEYEVYVFRGKGFAEKPMHEFFNEYHQRGEWFKMNDRIMNLISEFGEYVDPSDVKVPPHIKSHVLKFGKYINKDVVDLVKTEYSYCKSLVRYNKVPDKVKRFIMHYSPIGQNLKIYRN